MKNVIRLLVCMLIGFATFFSGSVNSYAYRVIGDINDNGRIGVEEAMHALQVVAGLKVEPQLSLAGTWEINSLASGPGAPWWERGPIVVGSDGSFSGTLTESDGTTGNSSGILDISTFRIITMSGSPGFRGSMDSGKTIMVWTDTWSSGTPGTTEISIITKKAESSYSVADLEGTWEVNGFASGPGAPWWERGPMVVDSDGSFSGTSIDNDGNTGGVSATMEITPDGIITIPGYSGFRGSMDSGKTVMVGTAKWESWQAGTTEIKVITKKAESYSLADLKGTWEINSLASGPGAPWWLRSCMIADSDGSVSGTQIESDGSTKDVSGTMSITSDGIITIPGYPSFRGCMDSDKTVVVGTDIWGEWQAGTTEISVWTKTSD